MTTEEILQKYQAEHDALGAQKDAPDKEAFDAAHRQIWVNCDRELEARRAELGAAVSLSREEAQELSELEVRLI